VTMTTTTAATSGLVVAHHLCYLHTQRDNIATVSSTEGLLKY
jgi:hypothetical protein